jgi:hypothetical protein
MRRFLPMSIALLVLSGLLAAPARAEDQKEKSPGEVFQAFAAAMKKEDIKTSLSHLTRDSQAWLTGMTIAWSMVSKEFSADDPKDGKARIAAIDSALKRHGVSVDGDLGKTVGDLKDSQKPIVALGETVKDKPGLASDFHKIITRMPVQSKFQFVGGATIQTFVSDGETAKGRMIPPSAADLQRASRAASLFELTLESALDGVETFYFKKEDGVWKIDMIETWKNVPPPLPIPQPQPSTRSQPPVVVYYPPAETRWCLFPRLRR